MGLDIVKRHWEDPNTASLKDKNLQQLERYYILDFFKKLKLVGLLADVGCGDAVDTMHWCSFAYEVVGYDYSSAMIKKAKENTVGKIKLFHFDLLKDEFCRTFDVVITKRCLINLGNFENQKRAILKIQNSIKDKGYYCMLECCSEGLNNLNVMRVKTGLEPLKMPFHNVYFNIDALREFVQKYFYIEQTRYFSTYYFLTRVYNQLLTKDKYEEFDTTAKEFHMALDIFGSQIIGPQFLMILKRK